MWAQKATVKVGNTATSPPDGGKDDHATVAHCECPGYHDKNTVPKRPTTYPKLCNMQQLVCVALVFLRQAKTGLTSHGPQDMDPLSRHRTGVDWVQPSSVTVDSNRGSLSFADQLSPGARQSNRAGHFPRGVLFIVQVSAANHWHDKAMGTERYTMLQ